MKRLARYLPFVIVLVVPMLFYPGAVASTWRSSSDVHAVLEFASSLLAITAGIMILLHFLGTGRRFFLAVSIGFVVIGTEELVHALFSFERIWPELPLSFKSSISTTWLAGNLALAISLLIALALGDSEIAPSKRIRRAAVSNAAAFAAATLLTWLIFISPIPPSVVQLGSTSKRLIELSLALLFLVAALLYANLYVKRQSRSPLLWSIVAFIVLRVAVHLLVFDARAFYDAHWDIAHVVALLSYLFPIFGVWGETVELQRSAHAQLVALEKEMTERRRAEEALQSERLLLRTLIDNIPDSIYSKDLACRKTLANLTELRYLGAKSETDILGKDDFSFYPQEIAERFFADDQLVMQTGEPVLNREEYILDEKQQKRWLLSSKLPLRNQEGRIVGLVGIGRDITEQKRAEAGKEVMLAQLRQSQKMEAIGQLAGGVAHDFNNLLTGILGNITLMRSSLPPTDPLLENLNAAETAAHRAADLTKGLLTFSRNAVVLSVPMNTKAGLDASLALLKQSLPATIEIVRDYGQPLWNVLLDQSQMTQILLNLGVNARDAMPGKGTLTVKARNEAVGQEYVLNHLSARTGEFVHISVMDTGPGLSSEIMQHLFEPFYTTKPVGSGTGLGLSIVYGAVKQAGGWITAVSTEGAGATFDIYLPRCLDEPTPSVTPSPLSEDVCSGTVLVVEDELVVCAVAQTLLSRKGYTVLTAPDGASALNVLRGHSGGIGLILLDMTMPGMTTAEIIRAIRALDTTVPILLNSGYTSNGSVHHMLDDGSVQGFLGKPYDLHQLLGKVQELLRRS